MRPSRYPVTANRGARGLILTRVLAVTLALDWVPAVLLTLALMAPDTPRTATARTRSTFVRCWPAGMLVESQHSVRPDRSETLRLFPLRRHRTHGFFES